MTMTRFFARNVHPFERAGRVVLGLGLVGAALAGPLAPWGYIGFVPIATGLLGSCPLYSVFGFSTCPVRTRSSAN
jgi:hypothetical protein